tara:strand:+ start:1145 stop:1318 length:174 start_codon:yes stop_codon:yes gene_type:complete
MNNIEKLNELKKIDYHLEVYIRKHTDVLKSVGNTDEQVADLIINRLSKVLNQVEKEK